MPAMAECSLSRSCCVTTVPVMVIWPLSTEMRTSRAAEASAGSANNTFRIVSAVAISCDETVVVGATVGTSGYTRTTGRSEIGATTVGVGVTIVGLGVTIGSVMTVGVVLYTTGGFRWL